MTTCPTCGAPAEAMSKASWIGFKHTPSPFDQLVAWCVEHGAALEAFHNEDGVSVRVWPEGGERIRCFGASLQEAASKVLEQVQP